MALSKSRRFEIFKRDSFTCQYCGQRPPEVVLEVDHINPRANGGDDHELNLITACWDCNRGKSDKRLDDRAPRPDADMAFLEAQQEVAEARRYLIAKQARDEAIREVIFELIDVLLDSFHWTFVESQERTWTEHFRLLLMEYGAEEIENAIRIVGPRYRGGLLQDSSATSLLRYMRGVLRNRRDA